MPKIYIANVTKQSHLLSYHMRNDHSTGKLIELPIESGHQIPLEDDQAVLEGIIRRYRRFGMIEIKEITRSTKFDGLMFQWEKPINMDRLKEAAERRGEVEDERANDMRIIGIQGDQMAADNVARKVGIQGIKVTTEIEEKQTQEAQARSLPAVRQKLSVDAENGTRRRA